MAAPPMPTAAVQGTGVRILSVLATVAAGVGLAAVVAYWAWRWWGPAPIHIAPAMPVDVGAALAVSPPFGRGAPVGAAPAVEAPAALSGDVRLLGVLAERDGAGRALFRMPDGKPRLVASGEALSPSATLVAVRPDGVTVREGGAERTIPLRAPAPASAARSMPIATAGASARQAACAPPPGYKGPVVRLNAELVQGLIAQPDSLRAVADPGEGGIVLRDETGFAALLGMKSGDRVTQANGIALRAPDDVIVAVLRPLAASQPVRVVGTRDGQPRELLLLNAGACPG